LNWTAKTDKNYAKIAYRVAVSCMGLKEYGQAVSILEEIKDCGD